MNIVLVSHCNFSGQSAYHVHSVAQKLTDRGCSCIICVPEGLQNARQHVESDVPIMNYEEALRDGFLFPDGKAPALVHCWTPREHVRRFTEAVVTLYRCPYIVHLEDNELEILKRYLKSHGYDSVDAVQPDGPDRRIFSVMIHPRRYGPFVQKAAGVTVLMDRLLEHVPAATPALVFWPGYDEIFSVVPRKDRLALRKKYGVPDDAFVVCYSGNFHAANREEIEQLSLSLKRLKNQGIPLHFIKTGITAISGMREQDAGNDFITDLGFVPRHQLPDVLAMTDVVVQPGKSDRFNDYRFPSKLPEALVAGKAVILPRSNLGRFLEDGVHALITDVGDAAELADKMMTLYKNPGLRQTLGMNGRNFALSNLQWKESAGKIMAFYNEICVYTTLREKAGHSGNFRRSADG